MSIQEVMTMEAHREHHIFWPTLLTIGLSRYHDGHYRGDPDVEKYLKYIELPRPNSEHMDFSSSLGEKPFPSFDNRIDRVVLPYAKFPDGVTLDVRDTTRYMRWQRGQPKRNELSNRLFGSTTKGDYYRFVPNIPGVYVIMLTSDDKILCAIRGEVKEGAQLKKIGEPALIQGAGDEGTLSEMAVHEIEEELGLVIPEHYHFLDRNLKTIPLQKYIKPAPESIEPDGERWKKGRKFDGKYDRNVSPFMILDKPKGNNPMATFLVRVNYDLDELLKLLARKREMGEADTEENAQFFAIDVKPRAIREEAESEKWGGSGASRVLLYFADFLEDPSKFD